MNRQPVLLQVLEVDAPTDTGAGWVVHGSARALRDRGWEVAQIAGDDLVPRLRGRTYGPLAVGLAARVRRRLARVMGDRMQCVIECHGFSTGLVALALRVFPARGVVSVFRSHGFWRAAVGLVGPNAPLAPRLIYRGELSHGLLESAGVRSSDGVLVQSAFDERFAQNVDGKAPESVLRAPPAVEQGQLPTVEPQTQHVVWIGRQITIKGASLVSELVPRLLARYPLLRVTLIGVEPSQFAAHERLTVHARLARPALAQLLQSATWFLWPSLYEGFGLAPFEAMARGVPIVSQRIGGLEGILEDGVNGIVVAEPRWEAYLEGFERALALSPQQRSALGQAAHRAASTLTWSAYADRVEPFYRSLLERKKAAERPQP